MSISGVISPSGFSYFEVRIMEGFKQKGLTRFLDNAWVACPKKLLVVWDNAPSHKSKTVKEYLAHQNEKMPRIWLENTPAYSPELNPIEQVWAYFKKKLANRIAKDVFELKAMVLTELERLKKDTKKILAFFKHKELECYHFFN